MLLLNHKHLHFAVDRICEFYKSTVIGLHLGPFPTIIINDLENARKSLRHRDFDGRPDIVMTRMRHPTHEPQHGKILMLAFLVEKVEHFDSIKI